MTSFQAMKEWRGVASAVVLLCVVSAESAATGNSHSPRYTPPQVQLGTDLNSAENPFVQPQDPALAGGGIDQTMQFGDVIRGSRKDDLQIGSLGTDVLLGRRGDDVFVGGLEHFNPLNRDRAFGGRGNDIFVWKPGDGSDLFDGGSGHDVVVFGVIGEEVDGDVVFNVVNDQQAGNVAIEPNSGLPQVDVSGSPGFCEVIDRHSSNDAKQQLAQLQLNHLVRFSLRGVRNAFEAGEQAEDNGLRVTLHLKGVETVVCTNRDGGEIEILDLTTFPVTTISIDDIRSRRLRDRLHQMVF